MFGLQVELDPLWAQSRVWRDLRLCELEAVCVQMEKYSSLLSRSYCTAFALPVDGSAAVDAAALPTFDEMPACEGLASLHSPAAQPGAMRGFPYNAALINARVHQERHGTAPVERQNNVERFRAYTIGPLPEREVRREAPKAPRKMASRELRKDAASRKASEPAPQPADAPGATAAPPESSRSRGRDGFARRKRTMSSAISRLSGLAGVLRDASDGGAPPAQAVPAGGPAPGAGPEPGAAAAAPAADNPKASYVFDGEDGHGLSLSQKKVRLSFSLPLVPSDGAHSAQLATPQLLPDYESPHMRIRHKLKVKMRFGFGTSPLATNAGVQSIVMCVPVRFSEAPASEALAQASPLVFPPTARSYVPAAGAAAAALPSELAVASHAAQPHADVRPRLPAYTQLFREDGSRVDDDAEVLPRYPDAPGAATSFAATAVAHEAAAAAAYSAQLAQCLYMAPPAEREAKTPAPISVVDALNAADDALFEVPNAVDDDLLDDHPMVTEVTGQFEDEFGEHGGVDIEAPADADAPLPHSTWSPHEAALLGAAPPILVDTPQPYVGSGYPD